MLFLWSTTCFNYNNIIISISTLTCVVTGIATTNSITHFDTCIDISCCWVLCIIIIKIVTSEFCQFSTSRFPLTGSRRDRELRLPRRDDLLRRVRPPRRPLRLPHLQVKVLQVLVRPPTLWSPAAHPLLHLPPAQEPLSQTDRGNRDPALLLLPGDQERDLPHQENS